MFRKILCALILIAVSAAASNALGQGKRVVLTMASGLTYEGRIISLKEISLENKGGGGPATVKPIIMVNDGLKRVFVNQYSIVNVAESSSNESELEIWQRVYEGPKKGAAPFIGASQFNENGHRIFAVQSKFGRAQYVQGITKLHPRYVEVKSLSGGTNLSPRDWKMSLAIGAIPTPVLKGVLENEIVDPERLTEWLQIPDFLYQAGRYTDAKDELLRISQKFPQHKEEIEAKRIIVLQEEAKQQLNEILLTFESGQTELGANWIQAIDRTGLTPETVVELDELLEQVEQNRTRRDELLQQVLAAVEAMENRPEGQLTEEQIDAIKTFKDEVTTDLNLHNIQRLDGFARLSADPKNKPQNNIALAISGWLLGSNRATDNWAQAQSLFAVRSLVRQYLNSTDRTARKAILQQLASYESSDVTYLAPLLANMLPQKHDLVEGYSGRSPIEFQIEIPGTKVSPEPRSIRCLAHLPTEYDPYRRYPLMIALPGAATVENHLQHWCGKFSEGLKVRYGHASRNGTIVVAVDWKKPGQTANEYSVAEHLTVLKALRESMRRFAVDSDRVFLQGHGIGADVAYDVGVAHPEHWAGIVAVSASGIRKYPLIYANNTGYRLPIYAVVGERHVGSINGCASAWNSWLQSQQRNELTVVQYNGRLDEQFLVEGVPDTFRWMRAQRRQYPNSSGFEFKCSSIRPADNYFWFLEIHGIPARNIKWPALFRERKGIKKIEIEGKIRDKKPNAFVVSRVGSGATLWLRPDYCDFSREIQISGRGSMFKGSAVPTREVILEDVRRRADFKRPYWAKLDYVDGTWE